MFVLLAVMYDEDILIVYVINFKKSAFTADFIMTVSLMQNTFGFHQSTKENIGSIPVRSIVNAQSLH